MLRRMSDATVELVYRGDAVEGGSMDVRDLAPALLALGDACQEANRVLNGATSELTVRVKSDFKTGSFEIHLEVFQKLLSAALDMVTGNSHESAADILTTLGFFGVSVPGLLQLWLWLKRQSPKSVTQLGNNNVQIEKADNSNVVVNNNVVVLANDPLIRKLLPKVFEPLMRPGFTKAEIRRADKTVMATVTSAEAADFSDLPSLSGDPIDQPLADVTAEAVLEVVRPSFQDRYIWTFTDGNRPFNVHIDHEEFLEKVDRHEIVFGAHDLLKVMLNTQTFRTPEGKLRTEQKIVRVLDVYPAGSPGAQGILIAGSKKS